MRICLLTNQNLFADPFPTDDWPCDPRPFFPDAEWEVEYVEKKTSVAQVTRRIEERFDVYFNLCDGAEGTDSAGIEVVQRLVVWRAHQLTGDRRGTWSLTVSRNWRLTFRVSPEGEIENLDFEDYH